jgi:hypothetical protein
MVSMPADVGGGALAKGVAVQNIDDEKAQALAAMGAAEAVATLEGDFAEGKMPDADGFTFPGPVAHALYWDDADIVGIQGPVGSGKTTTTLKSRLRRAVMMPRSVIDGWRRYKLLVVRETYRQLWSTTIPSYLETYPKNLGQWSGGRGDPVTHVIQFDDGDGPIEFRVEFMAFGDDVIASMRGVQTTDIWLNETDTVPVEVLTAGIGRIDRWPGASHFVGYPPELRGYGQIICDFNAPDEDNWTYRVFHDADERRRMTGALYFNSVASEMRVYTGAAWVAAYVSGSGYLPLSGGTLTGVLTVPAGAVGAPSVTISGDPNTGLWSPGADILAVSTGGVERLRVDASGNLGLGNTAPGQRLDVTGNIKLSGAIYEGVFTITDGAAVDLNPANGTIQLWTLGASRSPTATAFAAGQSMTLMIDDGTAYAITWPSVVWVGGSAPTLAASGKTVVELWKAGATLYGALVGSVA